MEYTGAEEVYHVTSAEPDGKQSPSKDPEKAFQDGNGGSKPEAKPASNVNVKATQA